MVDLQNCLSFRCTAKWFRFGCTSGKELACQSRHKSPIPGLGRTPGGGHGNPFQYSCLENPMTEACGAIIYRVAKSRTWLKRHTTRSHMVQLFPLWLISIHWIRSGEEMPKVSCLELMAANSGSRKNNYDSKKNKPIFTQQPLTWIRFLGW